VTGNRPQTTDGIEWTEIDVFDPHAVDRLTEMKADDLNESVLDMRVEMGRFLRDEGTPETRIAQVLDRMGATMRKVHHESIVKTIQSALARLAY
jgi:hypothetical protein